MIVFFFLYNYLRVYTVRGRDVLDVRNFVCAWCHGMLSDECMTKYIWPRLCAGMRIFNINFLFQDIGLRLFAFLSKHSSVLFGDIQKLLNYS